MGLEVIDQSQRSRFEVYLDGELAGFADYRHLGDRLSFPHVEVSERFTGRGLATALVRTALDEARQRGAGVLPLCPFVREFIARNPEYLDLVPADQRERFGL
jgi:predicted GNAT family acetyltransferase